MTIKKLRIATRHSLLALWQANHVSQQLQKHYPDLDIELVKITTKGDKDKTHSLAKMGGKSLFVKELQQALLEDKADIAVHSIKDMSVHEHSKLTLSAILERADAGDVFCATQYTRIDKLPADSIIGTASPRRQALVHALYPHLNVKLLRGNVDTRLKKLEGGDYDGIILAAAGVQRLGMVERIQSYLPKDTFTPAIGQGAMGIECLKTRDDVFELVALLHHEKTAICIAAERAVNKKLNGSCFTPLGAYATLDNDKLSLNAFVGSMDGAHIIRSHKVGDANDPQALGLHVADDLIAQGAFTILKHNQ